MSKFDRYDYNAEEAFEQLKGLMITKVEAEGSDASIFFENGQELQLNLEGDCCSHSYFQDPSQFNELVDSVVISIEERSGASSDEVEALGDGDPECVQWYFLVFVTDKGHVTIDWRNDSNGYYSGFLHVRLSRLEAPAC